MLSTVNRTGVDRQDPWAERRRRQRVAARASLLISAGLVSLLLATFNWNPGCEEKFADPAAVPVLFAAIALTTVGFGLAAGARAIAETFVGLILIIACLSILVGVGLAGLADSC
jgi:hypothetical protein